MKLTLMNPKIRDLVPGYRDDPDAGCFAMNGRLVCRPEYQRAFVYSDDKRDKVLDTVRRGLPLGIMYWMETPSGYELMDGQQRTLSILQYVTGEYAVDYRYFHNLSQAEKDQILDYELMIYACQGTDDERLEWFQTVNIAGEHLTGQELRNAVYSGPWCQDAKKYFSKPGGPAYQIAEKYLKGSALRQEYLETALRWKCHFDGVADIKEYMAGHQHDATALELWQHFRSVIDWVESTFPNYRKGLMKGLDWGRLYDDYGHGRYLDPAVLEAKIQVLLEDDDVTSEKGICEYVLGGPESVLSLRKFSDKDKRRKLQEQGGRCASCGEEVAFEGAEADHITPWSKGGHTDYGNLQVLCRACNRWKGAR